MKNELKKLRTNYAKCRMVLGYANRNKFSLRTKSPIMSAMNYARHALAKEIKRVSWLLWPETGRPGH